jgi:hypothetical protein
MNHCNVVKYPGISSLFNLLNIKTKRSEGRGGKIIYLYFSNTSKQCILPFKYTTGITYIGIFREISFIYIE